MLPIFELHFFLPLAALDFHCSEDFSIQSSFFSLPQFFHISYSSHPQLLKQRGKQTFYSPLMLNPPLSLLSDDLVDHLVEHVARLPGVFANRALHNLSLTDLAFTELCQKHIFRTLTLGGEAGSKSKISKRLKKLKRILDGNPLFANRVRKIELYIGHRQNAWLLQNPSGDSKDATLINVLQLLASSPIPPYELHLDMDYPIEDPVLVVGRLSQSFFSQTLTTLHLIECKNVPLPLFLICPRLKEVRLDRVAAEEGYGKYPDEHCSGRESPALDRFDYRDAHTVVKQMINPPSRFHTPVVLWSKLRILILCPREGEEMACLQPIIDAACNTLEELHLTNIHVGPGRRGFSHKMKQI